jgi:hypothetical protein
MKREAKLIIDLDSRNQVVDCYITNGSGGLVLASVDPRDFGGTDPEHIAKAEQLALAEARDVLRTLITEPENHIVNLARAVRAAQRAYFKTRHRDDLIASKNAEAALDKALSALPDPNPGPLFKS